MLFRNLARISFVFWVIFVFVACSFSRADIESKTPPPTAAIVTPRVATELTRTNQPNFIDLYKKTWQSVVWIKLTTETEGRIEPNNGSGVVVSSEEISSTEYVEYIITAYHVIVNWKKIYIHTPHRAGRGFERFLAEVVNFDKEKDLALLKTTTSYKIGPAVLGDSDNLEIGEWVYAIGCSLDRIWSLSVGVVGNLFKGSPTEEIQFDGSLRPGSSGGALFNTKGELVGITLYSTGSKPGHATSASVNKVRDFISKVKGN